MKPSLRMETTVTTSKRDRRMKVVPNRGGQFQLDRARRMRRQHDTFADRRHATGRDWPIAEPSLAIMFTE